MLFTYFELTNFICIFLKNLSAVEPIKNARQPLHSKPNFNNVLTGKIKNFVFKSH
jgi:hypothetical protein